MQFDRHRRGRIRAFLLLISIQKRFGASHGHQMFAPGQSVTTGLRNYEA